MGLRAKIRQNAAPLLAPGEQIQVVIPAQLSKPGPHTGVSHKLALIATDQRILICEGAWLKRSVIRKVLHELPRETEIGPPHGYWAYAFHVPDRPSVPIWIPRQFYKDVAQADAARLSTAAA